MKSCYNQGYVYELSYYYKGIFYILDYGELTIVKMVYKKMKNISKNT